jgi:hypothetical protein
MSCASQLARSRFLPFRATLACLLPLIFISMPRLSGSPQSSNSSPGDSVTIRGTVLNSATQAGVPRALVFTGDNRFAKLTDDEGHFELKVARPQPPPQPEGQSFASRPSAQGTTVQTTLVIARKPGYFDGFSNQVTIDSAASDPPPDLRIALTPEALIVGRVNLPANDGSDKIQVAIYHRQVQEGTPQWLPAGSEMSRANGEFRFANLREGDYKLFTQELVDQDPVTMSLGGPRFGYPPVYFPSAADFESAASIHLKAGQTFSASLTPSRREYYRVKLNIANAPAQGLSVSVEPQAHRGPGYSLGFNHSDNTIQGMLPNGAYTVELESYGPEGGFGSLNFTVNGAPVTGPTVAFVPASAIPVALHDERTRGDGTTFSPGNLLNAFQVRLVPTDEFRHTGPLVAQPSQNSEEPSAQINNVPPGSYRIRRACNPTGYVAAVSSGGRDLLQQPLVVGSGAAIPPLEVTIRDDGAQLEGKIDDWSPPGSQSASPSGFHSFRASNSVVVLLPMPDSSGQFCQIWVNPSGDFNFPQVPPGDYRALAFERLPEDFDYQNQEVMQQYESKAQELHLTAGQKQQVRLTLVGGSE